MRAKPTPGEAWEYISHYGTWTPVVVTWVRGRFFGYVTPDRRARGQALVVDAGAEHWRRFDANAET
jgi:hypothetical protein